MSYTQDDLDRIDAAMLDIAERGAASIQFGDRIVRFSTLAQLREFRAFVAREINRQKLKNASLPTTHSLVDFS